MIKEEIQPIKVTLSQISKVLEAQTRWLIGEKESGTKGLLDRQKTSEEVQAEWDKRWQKTQGYWLAVLTAIAIIQLWGIFKR